MAPLARDLDRLQVEASLRLLQLIEPNDLSDPDFLRYQAFLRRTCGERARRLGWMPRADDDVEARAIRSRLLPLVAGRGEDPALLEEARSLAGRWLADHGTVPSETAWGALNAAAIRGDRADKERCHAALGLFEEPALTRAALELAVDDRSDLRDTMVILNVTLSRRATRAQAWAIVQERWADLAPRLRADEGTWLVQQAAISRFLARSGAAP